MQFSHSLKENYLFRRLYARGHSAANRYLVLYCRKNRLGENRVGVTVSAKLGCAVVRNRIRRRLREIYRLHESQFLPGHDLVVVARGQAVTASYRQLEKAYLHLAGRLAVLETGGCAGPRGPEKEPVQ